MWKVQVLQRYNLQQQHQHTTIPCFTLSPGKPVILLHIYWSALEGHWEITMSPFLNFFNLTVIRSAIKTSLFHNVGSIDGPAHCAALKVLEKSTKGNSHFLSHKVYLFIIQELQCATFNIHISYYKRSLLTNTILPTYSLIQCATIAHFRQLPRIV